MIKFNKLYGLIIDLLLFIIVLSTFSTTLSGFIKAESNSNYSSPNNEKEDKGYQEVDDPNEALNSLPKESKSTGFNSLPNNLFLNNKSQGFIAICAAEGNCYIGEDGSLTLSPNYEEHEDPGNFATNNGGCSQQTPEPGLRGDPACLARFKRHQPKSKRLLNESFGDLNLTYTNKVLLLYNTMDMYNQASPIHAPRFVDEMKYLVDKGNEIDSNTIAIARTNAFYISSYERYRGNYATGLIGICQRENRNGASDGINKSTNRYKMEYFTCVELDQVRRVKQIERTLRFYKQPGG